LLQSVKSIHSLLISCYIKLFSVRQTKLRASDVKLLISVWENLGLYSMHCESIFRFRVAKCHFKMSNKSNFGIFQGVWQWTFWFRSLAFLTFFKFGIKILSLAVMLKVDNGVFSVSMAHI